MKKPIRVFLGDLTYDTITVSTESFPLNVGYIASYCLSKFGSDVDITIFKYIDKLEKAIRENPPDILGLSNYVWNHRIGYELFKILHEVRPNAIKIWGGPNFPLDIPSQEKFMKKYEVVDVYVHGEGEIGFASIIEHILKMNESDEDTCSFYNTPIPGCITRASNEKINYTPELRLKKLDDIPSPYLIGVLDPFFDGKLSPTIQTNRGCPFRCTFCTDGRDSVSKVNQFSMERVKEELDYIGKHVPKETKSMFLTDLNFGMMPRDLEISDVIAKSKEQYGFPEQIQATTGKNSKMRIINAVKNLSGSLRLYMSVQSMDKQVLSNIKRENISTDELIQLAPVIKQSNLRTTSEVILGLPGESKQSHIESLRKLAKANMDDIQVYTCMMLNGSELNIPTEREKWGLKTKYRILSRDFVKLSNNKNIIETEEVVISSNTLDFDEYIDLRLLAFAIWVTNKGIVYDPILKFLRQNQIDVFELFTNIAELKYNPPESIKEIFASFRKFTVDELWDSPEEIEDNYQRDSEYQKLVDGEEGINIMYHHHALVLSNVMDDWTEYVIRISENLLESKLDDNTIEYFKDVSTYCKGLSHNPLGPDRLETNPLLSFNYDIQKWVDDQFGKTFDSFRLNQPNKFSFELSNEQYNFVQDKLNIYGDTPVGRSQALKRIPIQKLWRRPIKSKKDLKEEKEERLFVLNDITNEY